MGSALASMSPIPPAAGRGSLYNMPSSRGTGAQAGTDTKTSRPNPGSFQEFQKKCRDVFPLQMEGVHLLFNRGLSSHFQVKHLISRSTMGASGYRFSATYAASKQTGPDESFSLMEGDMDNSGSLNVHVVHQLTRHIRSKMGLQTLQHIFLNWQCEAEYRGDDFTADVTLGNPDALHGSGILVAHYLRSLSPSLVLGGELVYQRMPWGKGLFTSLMGRYTGNNYVATLTAGGPGVHASYYHKANDQLQVGVEFVASTQTQQSSMALGYQVDLPKANLQFKGSLGSNWVIGATLEKKLPPLPLSLALSAFLDHRKNRFQCGFGVSIG